MIADKNTSKRLLSGEVDLEMKTKLDNFMKDFEKVTITKQNGNTILDCPDVNLDIIKEEL